MQRVVLILALAIAPSMALAQDTTTKRAATQGPITFAEAIRLALANNTAVQTARNQARLDALTVRSARYAFLPDLAIRSQLSQGFGSGRTTSAQVDTVTGSPFTAGGNNPFATSLGISTGVTLFNGGQNINTLRQAQLNERAGLQDVTRARQTMVFQVATDFLDLNTQQEQLRVQQENLAAQLDELSQLEAFVQQETRPVGDLYQQQAAVAATRLAVANAEHGVELARTTLIETLVLDPRGTYTFVMPTPRDTSSTPVQFNLDSLMTVATAERADVRAMRLRVEAAQREVKIASGARLPSLGVTTGYSSTYSGANDASFGNQLSQRRGGSVGLDIGIPIWDRGASSIAKQRAQVQVENETLALRDMEHTVQLEVRRAYFDYVAALSQITAANEQQRAAALALEAAQARYRAGSSTFVEVTLARASLVQAQSAVVNARSSAAFQRAIMSYYTGVLGEQNARIER